MKKDLSQGSILKHVFFILYIKEILSNNVEEVLDNEEKWFCNHAFKLNVGKHNIFIIQMLAYMLLYLFYVDLKMLSIIKLSNERTMIYFISISVMV